MAPRKTKTRAAAKPAAKKTMTRKTKAPTKKK